MMYWDLHIHLLCNYGASIAAARYDHIVSIREAIALEVVLIVVGVIAQHLPGFIVFLIVLGVFLIIYGIAHAGDEENRQRRMNYIEASDKIFSATDSRSIETVKNSIERLDYEYSKVKEIAGQSGNNLYTEDRKLLKEHLHDLEQEKWEKKANKYLQEFSDCYLTIISGEFENFKDVDALFREKSRCIALWQRYFAIDLSEFETTIYPKKYLREWMGEDYDPCMESHDALEKKLSAIVDTMRPEYKRKNALYGIIVNHVAALGSVARADLLKTRFGGFISDEVKCCYKVLIKTNRLVEVKLGEKYFVSLSDKEAAKKQNQTEKEEQKMIASSDKLVHDAIVKHLMDEGVEYIDMTHKGGGLYFFSERVAEELKGKGYNIGYAEKGSRSTSGRPAWYLRK